MRVLEYQIISRARIKDTEVEINNALTEGWELWGNPFVCKDGFLHQAMVRFEPDTPTPIPGCHHEWLGGFRNDQLSVKICRKCGESVCF